MSRRVHTKRTVGGTGSTRLDRVGAYLAAQSMSDSPMILLALSFLLVGFAFKISAVPFHMWTHSGAGIHGLVFASPDSYAGCVGGRDS